MEPSKYFFTFLIVCFAWSLHIHLEPNAKNNPQSSCKENKAMNLPLWSVCLPQPCRCGHRMGQTSCPRGAGRRAWAGNLFCRWIQTGPGSAAWGNLKTRHKQTHSCPLSSAPRGAASVWEAKAQQRPGQRTLEAQHWPAVVENRSSGLKKISVRTVPKRVIKKFSCIF